MGTRFAARMTSGRRRADMVIETTEYDRPRRLGSVTTMDMANINGVITFDAGSAGTVMIWAWEVHPGGVARFFAPLIAIVGRRQERTIWGGLKQYLESTRHRCNRLLISAVECGSRSCQPAADEEHA